MTNSDAADDSKDGGQDAASVRVHRPRRAVPTDVVRPTRAEVHLSALRHNLGQLRRVAGQASIWGVLKADAYGHGSKAVGRTLERAGIDGICVALVEEGVELREAGIELPILVMGGYYGNAFSELRYHRLTPVLSDQSQVERLARAARTSIGSGDERFSCHVKVDTGMARLGVRAEEVQGLVQCLTERPCLEVTGLMTHLANADVSADGVFEEPLRRFEKARAAFEERALLPRTQHMANSAALLRDARTHFQQVRPGVALFGIDPLAESGLTDGERAAVKLKPAMSVSSRIVSLRQLEAGETVGYGGTFRATGSTRIATVPMGYADGLSRAMSNRGQALVRGRRVPIVGNVSMDMVTLDVTALPSVRLGDEVVFLGTQKFEDQSAEITASDLAKWSDTIAWEVLTNISRRVPRFYREA